MFSGKGAAPVLFLNAKGANQLTIEVRDAITGAPIPGLSAAEHVHSTISDSDRLAVSWKGGAAAQGKRCVLAVRLSSPQARLYSFWVSPNKCGASGGWVAAGGAGFNASRDTFTARAKSKETPRNAAASTDLQLLDSNTAGCADHTNHTQQHVKTHDLRSTPGGSSIDPL